MLRSLVAGSVVLDRFIVTESSRNRRDQSIDATIELELCGEKDRFRFAVEAKTASAPRAIESAVAQIQKATGPDENPMIFVPYLSPESLRSLEEAKVSGIDLCGNGVVIVPRRLYVVSTGQANRYPDSRPLSNPYRGRSAMVARTLLSGGRWDSLNALRESIQAAGLDLSLSQTSKAVAALQDDLIVTKQGGAIVLNQPLKLLDQLGAEWKRLSPIRSRQAFRLPLGTDVAKCFASAANLQWAITGESSVSRYAMFAQGGPQRIAVSDLQLAQSLLPGKPEVATTFADIELLETSEPGYYFENTRDEQGVRWASRLQTWLELQAGDARQQNAAAEIRNQLLSQK
ncbi:hypothetical protein [Anatilimnocola floriformis]|uniref:hypothetical protein n=1 Tax=Anatilimnocola floriformis TaxID=2948575 RepID=UPI0020C3230A|nr:hypothetical protein [Anatilimnocola floriformis]